MGKLHQMQSTLTNTSPHYNASSCSSYVSFPFVHLQDSFSHSSFKADTYLNCTHKHYPTQIDTNSEDVDRKHAIAGLLQHACSYQRDLQGEGQLDTG